MRTNSFRPYLLSAIAAAIAGCSQWRTQFPEEYPHKYGDKQIADIYLGSQYKEEITKDDYRTFLILLNPIAPHITEELNEKYALGEAICKSSWPKYDIAKTVDQEKEIAVQVNGKVRATITININEDEESIKEKALTAENVKNHTAGKEIVKVIIIKGKIVNIVVK